MDSTKTHALTPTSLPPMIAHSLEEILSFVTKKSMNKCFKQLIIDYNIRILLQILRVKSCSHILVVHLISK
jgi:hypothetical protein